MMTTSSHWQRFRAAGILLALLCIGSGVRGAEPLPTQDGFEDFITRKGDKLYEGEREFRFAGANMPGLSLPYDYTLRLPDRMILPTVWEQNNAFETLVAMNARVVRLWNLPIRGPNDDWMDWAYVQGPGKFNEESFKTLDNLLALANRHGVRVIFSLGAEWGDYLGGIGEYAAWRGKERAAFYTDAQIKQDYKDTLRYVVNRRNTVTGRLYRDDKAILAWQFGNEMRNAPLEWETEMADYLKSLDPNHLVMAGNDSRVPENPPENLDIVVRHYYNVDWLAAHAEDSALAKGKRPFIVGEYGLRSDVDYVRLFHEAVRQSSTSGSLIWSLYFHHRFGGFYWHQIFTHPSMGSFHWPGFASGAAHNERPLLELVREYGFHIAGLPVPAVAVPKRPELLPIAGRLPFLTWRGSVGASGYDIERAESADGPWSVVARDVPDGDVAYRPLFNDTSAKTGTDYYYRVSARNVSGVSKPSAAFGPVRFASQVLVDEFRDLELSHAKTDGLTIDNAYNGLYAEYLFRAKGAAGEALTYRLPAPGGRLRLVAFHDGEIRPPEIEVSADGASFQRVAVAISSSMPLASFAKVKQLAGMRRTMVEYAADFAELAPRYVRVTWTGEMEIDRIEIEHGEGS